MKYDRKYYTWVKVEGDTLYLKIRLLSDNLADASYKFYYTVVGTKKIIKAYKWNWLKKYNEQFNTELKNIIIQ